MSLSSFAKRIKKRAKAPYNAYLKSRQLPLLETTCLLEAGQGKNINGNMFALVRTLRTSGDFNDIKVALVTTRQTSDAAEQLLGNYGISGVELVTRNSPRYKELLARAHYLFTDNSFPTYFMKRDEQVYVNTWHGTPLKHLGHSDLENAIASMANVQKNMLAADYVLFPNELTKRVFWDDYQLRTLFSHEYLMCDYPRNDALLDSGSAKRVRERYDLSDKNVIAYLPTWRGARRSADVEGQKRQIQHMLEEIDARLSENDLLYVNLHFLVTGGMDFSSFRHVRPFPDELETYDFLACCDTLVTDYSSVFFDFAATGRKIVLFAYDKQDYLENKGTYLDYDALPFPMAETPEELVPLVQTREHAPYDEFRETYCAHATGHASHDLLDLVVRGDRTSVVPQRNAEARPHVAYFVSGTRNLALNDIVRAELKGMEADAAPLFVCAGKYGQRAVDLLRDVAQSMPYLCLVSSHVQTTAEKYSLFAASRSRAVQAFSEKSLARMAERELDRLFPGISIERFVDLNANASYLMKLLSFSATPHEGALRDGALTRLRREGQTQRLSHRFPLTKADVSRDRSLVSEEARERYFAPAMRARLLTRAYEHGSCSMHGLALVSLARGVRIGDLSLRLPDGTVVGSVRDVLSHRCRHVMRYEIAVPREALPDLPIHSQVYLCCQAPDGLSGRVSARFNTIDRNHSTSRVGRLWIDEATQTTSYFRQAAKNTLCFTTRDTISIDPPAERKKITLARLLSRILPLYRNTILLYEKNASRYEESASVVFERLIDEGRTEARFILNPASHDFAKIGEKYLPYVVRKNSLTHYLMFFSARTFIGTEMLAHAIDVRPANRKVSRRLSNKNINYVFLQHGVMYMLSLDSSSRTFFRPKKLRGVYRVVVSSELEKLHFVERGGYDPQTLYVCGLPKYDRNRWNEDAGAIAIMPTWRPWEYNAARAHFADTGYFRFIASAVSSVPKRLRDKIIVLPHPLFKEAAEGQDNPYVDLFEDGTESYDQILRRTRLLITDYSSIAYDAFYRGANVLFYWQDKDECLEQYGAGSELMIDEDTAFGRVVWDPARLSDEDFTRAYDGPQSAEHVRRYQRIVEFHDGRNTDRLMELMHEDGLV